MATNEEEYWAAIATVIRKELTGQEMSQAQLAAAVGIGREAMNKYLKGRREMPFTTFLRVANTLDLTPQWIFAEADNRLK